MRKSLIPILLSPRPTLKQVLILLGLTSGQVIHDPVFGIVRWIW
jgi:hypothetical protein